MHRDQNRAVGVDRIADRRRGPSDWNEDPLAHREVRSRVDTRRRDRRVLDGAQQRATVDFARVALDAEADPVAVHQLQRIGPDFEARRAIAADESPLARHDDEAALLRLGGAPAQIGERRRRLRKCVAEREEQSDDDGKAAHVQK